MSTETNLQTDGTSSAPEGLDRRILLIAGVVVLGAIMSILDTTIVSVAQNTFQDTWHTTPSTSAWTMTGYTLALAAVIPATGWAADRFGTKRLYMMSIFLFVVGSVLCACAGGITELIIFRVIQGLGGGMLMPLGMTILTRAAGPERIGRVMAVLGIPMLLGPIAGPILGGWLIQIASWHWIFLINVPIGAIGLVYAFFVLDKDETAPTESFDFVGFLLLSPGLALFLFGVSSIPAAQADHGTMFTPRVEITMILGLIMIVSFVFWALRRKNPLLDLRLFKNRNMSVSMVTFILFAIAFFGGMLLYSQYFIGVRGETTLMAGLLMAPQGLGAMVTMPVAGTLTDKMGPGKFVMSGIVLLVIGMSTFTWLHDDTSYWLICGSLFVQGLGMGMTMMPIMTAALRTLKPHDVARGSTLTNIVNQIGASSGTAIISVVFTNALKNAGEKSNGTSIGATAFGLRGNKEARRGIPADQLQKIYDAGLPHAASAFSHAFMVSITLVALCIIPAFFLPRTKAESTSDAPVMVH